MKRSEIFQEETVVSGDLQEVMKACYTDTLQQLEKELDHLNILDHPIEVQNICRKIKAIKNKLQVIKNRRLNR